MDDGRPFWEGDREHGEREMIDAGLRGLMKEVTGPTAIGFAAMVFDVASETFKARRALNHPDRRARVALALMGAEWVGMVSYGRGQQDAERRHMPTDQFLAQRREPPRWRRRHSIHLVLRLTGMAVALSRYRPWWQASLISAGMTGVRLSVWFYLRSVWAQYTAAATIIEDMHRGGED